MPRNPTPSPRQPTASRPLPPGSAARPGALPAAGQLPVAPIRGAKAGGPTEEVAAVAVLGYN